MSLIRTFIAVDFPENIKQQIKQLQSNLSRWEKIKWVDPVTIHLTLKFLGNIEETMVEEIGYALSRGTISYSPFSLKAYGCGAFPSISKIRVVWVGLAGDLDVLTNLQCSVEGEILKMGFPKEERPFKPHVTIGRCKEEIKKSNAFTQALLAFNSFETETFLVSHVVLFKSTLTPQGAIYDPLVKVTLKKG